MPVCVPRSDAGDAAASVERDHNQLISGGEVHPEDTRQPRAAEDSSHEVKVTATTDEVQRSTVAEPANAQLLRATMDRGRPQRNLGLIEDKDSLTHLNLSS
jgi:hypothetical protein